MFFADLLSAPERYGNDFRDALRALPLAWRVKKTQRAIGFREQKEALETVTALIPEGARA